MCRSLIALALFCSNFIQAEHAEDLILLSDNSLDSISLFFSDGIVKVLSDTPKNWHQSVNEVILASAPAEHSKQQQVAQHFLVPPPDSEISQWRAQDDPAAPRDRQGTSQPQSSSSKTRHRRWTNEQNMRLAVAAADTSALRLAVAAGARTNLAHPNRRNSDMDDLSGIAIRHRSVPLPRIGRSNTAREDERDQVEIVENVEDGGVLHFKTRRQPRSVPPAERERQQLVHHYYASSPTYNSLSRPRALYALQSRERLVTHGLMTVRRSVPLPRIGRQLVEEDMGNLE